MNFKSVILAPVPAENIASALSSPRLMKEVAFGTSLGKFDFAEGTEIYIYASLCHVPNHPLNKPGVATFAGTLGKVAEAVKAGPRMGMHPDARVRPQFAEQYDYRDAKLFFHVHGLHQLPEPIGFNQFMDRDGSKLFGGFAPLWPVAANLRTADLQTKDFRLASPILRVLRAA